MPKLNCNCKLAVILILTLSIGNLWAQPIRWNVLLFVSDEHSPHFMSIDSQLPQNISTPNLERLAKQGMVFDKTYVAYPVCAPTRASIITGEYPQTHRQLGNSEYLIEAGPNGKTPSLGLLFRAEGYNTALLGKTHSNVQLWDANPGMLFQGKELFIGFDYRLDAPDNSRHSEVPAHIPSDAIWAVQNNLWVIQVETAASRPTEDDEFFALAVVAKASRKNDPDPEWIRTGVGCTRNPRAVRCSGCTPAEPYPPDRKPNLTRELAA